MPEGPEVTRIAKDLNSLTKGKELLNIKILSNSKYEKKAPDNFQSFLDKLPLRVEEVNNKGKLIYFVLEKNNYIINHLIMSGHWSTEYAKYASLKFEFNNNLNLYFCDMRKFGYVEFLNKEAWKDKLAELGPDFLNNKDFDVSLFKSILERKKRCNISTVLMNQKLISGIGNYLKAEMLYAARINPHRTISSLSEKEIETLFKEGQRIIKTSYRLGGTSKRDYIRPDGEKGTFQDFLKVYSKTTDPEGRKVVREKTKDGRSTYWVPELQK
jgi:formamidopyrimidine-DNA glycosylase